MSRKRRLEALRSRRAAGVDAIIPDVELPPEIDWALERWQPDVVEPLPPIPVPAGLRGSYYTCGLCDSYIAPNTPACLRCSGVL